MLGKGKLTDLLTSKCLDPRRVQKYCRCKKLDKNDFNTLFISYKNYEMQLLNCQVTLLHCASSGAKPDFIRILVKEGWRVDTDLPNLGSPLQIALEYGNIAGVRCLLELGADPICICRSETTPMHSAMINIVKRSKSCLNCVKLLVKAGVSVNAVINIETFERPLHRAVFNNLLPVVSYLLQMGADIDAVDIYGCTPLHIAVYDNNLDIIKLLARHRADMYKENVNGETPLLLAVKQGSIPSIEALVSGGCDVNRLLDKGTTTALPTATHFLLAALRYKCFKLVKLLIKLGANVNEYVNDCDIAGTIFHGIVCTNHDIIHTSLEFGADYNACNSDGLTPYYLAIAGMIDVTFVQSFVKYGCPFNQDLLGARIGLGTLGFRQFFKAQSRFFKGVKENNLRLVISAVKDGAIVNGCSENMKYPLNYVASKGYKEVLTYLLENNVPPNCLNHKGESPIFNAAKEGHNEICHTLLKFGAIYNYSSGVCPKKPSEIASELKHKEVCDLFNKVSRMFKFACSKSKSVVKELKKIVDNDINDFLMFINATNAKGDTLISTASCHSCDENAQEMIILRTKYGM